MSASLCQNESAIFFEPSVHEVKCIQSYFLKASARSFSAVFVYSSSSVRIVAVKLRHTWFFLRHSSLSFFGLDNTQRKHSSRAGYLCIVSIGVIGLVLVAIKFPNSISKPPSISDNLKGSA